MPRNDKLASRRDVLKYVGGGVAFTSLAGCTGGGDGGGGGTPEVRTVVRTVEGEERTVVKTVVKEQTRKITALGGITGGSGYQQCLVFQQAVHKEFPNVRVTVSGTSGWKTDAKLMWDRGEAEFGIVPAGDLYGITHGTGDYQEEKNYILMAFPGVPPSPVHIVVRKDSDITTYADLEGKRVNILSRGSLTASLTPEILSALGVEPAKYLHFPHQEAANALSQGDIDAAGAGGIAAPYSELSQTSPVRVLSLEEDQQPGIKDQLPSIGFSNPDFSTWYKGAGEALVPTAWIVMAALADLEDDFVYELVKATFENRELGAQIYEPFDTLKPEMAAQTGLPVHPGAYRYYEEQGVDIPDAQAPPHDFPLG